MVNDGSVNSAGVLVDGFGRVREEVNRAVEGLSVDELAFRIDGAANSVAWLTWHLARIQDDHVADAAQTGQVWLAGGWGDRFGLPFDRTATGYGQTAGEVAQLRATAELLLGYHEAVQEQTLQFVRDLTDADLDRVVDTSWDPPVTLGVRLVSVLSDALQHAGQAAFIRGILTRA
jgi:hypothetical protein